VWGRRGGCPLQRFGRHADGRLAAGGVGVEGLEGLYTIVLKLALRSLQIALTFEKVKAHVIRLRGIMTSVTVITKAAEYPQARMKSRIDAGCLRLTSASG
jgi:hypothetical protein